MLRPVMLRRYFAVMQSKGYKPAAILSGCDVDPRRLDDETYLIDLATYHQVIENMLAISGDEGLGFDIGLAHQLDDFGVLAYASMSGTNQHRNAEEVWNRYGETVGIMTQLTMNEVGKDRLAMEVNVVARSEPIYRFFIEELIAVHFSIGADWIGRPPVFTSARFSFPEPAYAQRYAAMLDCPIRFNARKTVLTLESDWYEQPIKTRNPELKKLVEQRLEDLQRRISATSPLAARVRDVFLKQAGRIVKIDEVAQALRTSSRTLSRELQARGVSYQGLLDEFLAEAATELIHRKSDKAPIKEISAELGFSDVNAFRRAFKRWTGLTVQEYRAQKSDKTGGG